MFANKLLIFDTETTGLFPKNPAEEKPYITQLSFIVYDLSTESIRSSFNSYISIPDEVEIPEIVTEITGITKYLCLTQGIPIQEALAALYHASVLCDTIIAHNIEFDIKMVLTEIQRNLPSLKSYPEIKDMFHPNRLAYYNIKLDCTMQLTVDACSLLRTTNKNYTYKKFPKLKETYEFLFKKPTPDNLHNSIIDVIVCLRCYVKIKYDKEISDEKFQIYLKRFNQ
jgi:DNA polymerase III epsilon subunit-like protein